VLHHYVLWWLLLHNNTIGIKRPHLNWRAPEGYVDLYPFETVAAPKQLTLDRSIDPMAWAAFPMNAPLGKQRQPKASQHASQPALSIDI
jgi:hypothetical protein